MTITTKHPLVAQLLTHLRNPLKLQIAVITALWLVGYGFLVRGVEKKIADVNAQIAVTNKQLAICKEIENLQVIARICDQRTKTYNQENEWVEELLAATRACNLLVVNMLVPPNGGEPHGPYTAISLGMEIRGNYSGFIKLLQWCEATDRALRVDSVHIKRERTALSSMFRFCGLVKIAPPESAGAPTTGKAKAPDATTATKGKK